MLAVVSLSSNAYEVPPPINIRFFVSVIAVFTG